MVAKSTLYYRTHPKARKKKAKTDKKINRRPEQMAKRRQLARLRYRLKKKGVNLKGKDLSHTKRGIVLKPSSVNRGSKGDTKGDCRSRGKCRKRRRR